MIIFLLNLGKHKRKRHKESGGTENTGDSDGESVPNFPQAAVGGDETNNGEEFAVAAADEPLRNGDVVWGKVMGFPWWPGKYPSASNRSNWYLLKLC